MKKFFSLLLALSLLITPVLAESSATDYPVLGVQMALPPQAEEQGMHVISNQQLLNLLYQNGNDVTALMVLQRMNESLFSLAMADESTRALLEKNHMIHLGTQEGTVYLVFHVAAFENPADYFSSLLNMDYAAFSDEMKAGIEENRALVQQIADSIALIPTDFSTTDVFGQPASKAMIKEKDITVVYAWATSCGPCVEALPELNAWQKELPENVQIMGLLCDVAVGDDAATARAILEKTNTTFPNLLASEDMLFILENVRYTPTTFFLDENGNFICEPVIGASVTQFKAIVEEYLK